ncbi:hypothetical protein, partial [Salinibacterium sp.]|uniref:hypothetical protein n=1 Tax=Salinibacterium sp. TaxID=1915057 RepID=UPI00286A4B7C
MSTKYRSYVESLTTAQRDALGTLSARVLTNVRPLYEVSGDISSFIFAGGETSHPDWDDATTVFEAAVEQLLLQPDVPPIAGELPLLFVGWHSKNRVTGKRASLGFLLTDRRLHAQCDFGVLFGVTPPRTYSYPIGSGDPDGDSAALVDAANARFDWTPAAELVSLAQQAAIKRLLVDEIADITGAVTRLGIEMA